MNNMHYILASASPRRRELLALAGLPFTVCAADVNEHVVQGTPPQVVAETLAAQKARAVAGFHHQSCVIGADTVVAADNAILGKPTDAADAVRMLRMLSDREHRVITGVCLRLGGRERTFAAETLVRFYPLCSYEIEQYVNTGESMDKAGAYGIQGKGGLFVEGITGDYYNVVGLPIAKLMRELELFLKDKI
jgi:septum formation protein